MSDLSLLPNIGKKLVEELEIAGITTARQLKEMGSVAALARIRQTRDSACFNMLYALEGAIRGMRWHFLPEFEKERLRKALARLDAGSVTN